MVYKAHRSKTLKVIAFNKQVDVPDVSYWATIDALTRRALARLAAAPAAAAAG